MSTLIVWVLSGLNAWHGPTTELWRYEPASTMRASASPTSRFADVVRDPLGEINRLYQKLGIALNLETETRMRDWLEHSRSEQLAPHRYTAADFGLSTPEIHERFTDYVERFMSA